MKKIYSFVFLLGIIPLVAFSQVEMVVNPGGTIVSPGNHQRVLSVILTSDDPFIVNKCWLSVSDTTGIDHFYLEMDDMTNETTLGFSQAGYENMWVYSSDSMFVYPHFPSHYLSTFASGESWFEYFIDVSQALTTPEIDFSLSCSVYPNGQSSSTSYTDTVYSSVSVVLALDPAVQIDPNVPQVVVQDNQMLVPKETSVSVFNMLGSGVFKQSAKHSDKKYSLGNYKSGCYILVEERFINGKRKQFVKKFYVY
jgi:hypothetical protein